MHVAHGSLDERQFVALFGRDGRIVGALGFNRPRQVMQYRRLIADRGDVGPRRSTTPTASDRRTVGRRAEDATDLLTRAVRRSSSCAGSATSLALAMLTPVLPHYVEESSIGGKRRRGFAVGAFAVGAIVLRPFAGRIGDTMGRRVLIVGGRSIVAVSTACYGLVHALWCLTAIRGS